MLIITLLVCLLAEWFLNSLQSKRNYNWYFAYIKIIERWSSKTPLLNSKLGVILILLPFPVIAGYLDLTFYKISPILEFIFSCFVLLYSFGPESFFDQSKEFVTAQNNQEPEKAKLHAKNIMARPVSDEEAKCLNKTITRSLLNLSNNRIFGIIFWFSILGPMGAILFRCSNLYIRHIRKNNKTKLSLLDQSAHLFFDIVNWIPARLTSFGFAAMGNFIGAINYWENNKKLFILLQQNCNEELIMRMGLGALNIDNNNSDIETEKINQCNALIRRTIMLWLGTISVLTLSGWI